tara:strand:+ start:533 stop:679 length:147 start_codon:yes stop_codon:yes gene_type:complete
LIFNINGDMVYDYHVRYYDYARMQEEARQREMIVTSSMKIGRRKEMKE